MTDDPDPTRPMNEDLETAPSEDRDIGDRDEATIQRKQDQAGIAGEPQPTGTDSADEGPGQQ